jgi:uncharacterized protein
MRRLHPAPIALLIIVFCLFATAADNRTNSPAPEQSLDQWKADLVEDLKQNWLPLVGLYWLKPGENSFGTASDNAVVFPKGPAHAGVFTLQGDQVTLHLSSDAHATIARKQLSESPLQPDTSGKPTVIEMGSLRFHLIKRGQRLGIRLKDLDSDAVKNYRGPIFFPSDTDYRVVGKWIPSDGKRTVDVPNVLGDVTQTPVPGSVEFTIRGRVFHLTALSGDPAKSLFIVFNDLTSKFDTYPGGRFLDAGPVNGDSLVLDFNRAYNPPCAVTPYATCPLAPRENRLQVAIPAGEKYDRSHAYHH